MNLLLPPLQAAENARQNQTQLPEERIGAVMYTTIPTLSVKVWSSRPDHTGKLLKEQVSCGTKARGRWQPAVPVLHIEQGPGVSGDATLALWCKPGVLNPLQKAVDVFQVVVFLKKGKAKAFITS